MELSRFPMFLFIYFLYISYYKTVLTVLCMRLTSQNLEMCAQEKSNTIIYLLEKCLISGDSARTFTGS